MQSCGEWSATSPLWDATVTLAPGEADLWFVFSDDLAPKMAAALACDGSLQVLTRCGSRSACPYRYRYRFFTPE